MTSSFSGLVYLHPMVRDAHGRKMTKSDGNVVDPQDVIGGIKLEDLRKKLEAGNLDPTKLETAKKTQAKDFPEGIPPECGADALRFALVSYTAQSDKMNLDILRVVGYRHWCNKLWNAVRFATSKLGDDYTPPAEIVPSTMPFICQWILSVLNKAIAKTVSSLDSFEFSDAATAVNSWWQLHLCDVFIEVFKPYFVGNDPALASATRLAQDTLWLCLDNGLRLLHPFMPFITEELWQRLPSKKDSTRKESIVISEYPSTLECWTNDVVESEWAEMIGPVVKSLRSLRAQLAPNERQERRAAFALCRTNDACDLIKKHELEIATLATLSSLDVLSVGADVPEDCIGDVVNEFTVFLKLHGNHNVEAKRERRTKKIEDIQKQCDGLKKKMSASGYQEKVPVHIREAGQAKLSSLLQELLSLKDTIKT